MNFSPWSCGVHGVGPSRIPGCLNHSFNGETGVKPLSILSSSFVELFFHPLSDVVPIPLITDGDGTYIKLSHG